MAVLSAPTDSTQVSRHAAQLRQADEHDVRARTTDVRAQGHDAVRTGRRSSAQSIRAIPNDLKYVYEKNLVALPTLAVTLAARSNAALRSRRTASPTGCCCMPNKRSRCTSRCRSKARVVSEAKIDEIYDKGAAKGAIMYMTRRLYEASSGDLLVTMGNVAFLRADGGFGGKSEGAPKPRPVPADRAADLQANLPVTLSQALIYRLSGDYNPCTWIRCRAQRRLRPTDPARTRRIRHRRSCIDQSSVRR